MEDENIGNLISYCNAMGYSPEEFEVFVKGYEKGRADGSAEVIEKFAEEVKALLYNWFESGVINVCAIDKIAKQLKEQK